MEQETKKLRQLQLQAIKDLRQVRALGAPRNGGGKSVKTTILCF